MATRTWNRDIEHMDEATLDDKLGDLQAADMSAEGASDDDDYDVITLTPAIHIQRMVLSSASDTDNEEEEEEAAAAGDANEGPLTGSVEWVAWEWEWESDIVFDDTPPSSPVVHPVLQSPWSESRFIFASSTPGGDFGSLDMSPYHCRDKATTSPPAPSSPVHRVLRSPWPASRFIFA
jgi:hypothetical protein